MGSCRVSIGLVQGGEGSGGSAVPVGWCWVLLVVEEERKSC